MTYLWRLLIVAGFGILGIALLIGLNGHGLCGSYLITLSAAQVGLLEGTPGMAFCYGRVNAAGLPFWAAVFAALIVFAAAIVIRRTYLKAQNQS